MPLCCVFKIRASTRSIFLATGRKRTKVSCVYLPALTEKEFTHYPEILRGMMDASNDATATLATGPLKCLWRLLRDESWLGVFK